MASKAVHFSKTIEYNDATYKKSSEKERLNEPMSIQKRDINIDYEPLRNY